MTIEITKAKLLKWIEGEDEEFNLESFRRKHDLSPESNLYRAFSGFVTDEKILVRQRRGWYRKIRAIRPILWWNGEEGQRIPLIWPYGIEDDSSFGFDDSIEIYPGDSIVIAGQSNMNKSAMALNLLVNNLHLFVGSQLMVNEFKPQRFRARMQRFDWVDFWNEGKPKFDLLPVTQNHQDYIKPNYQNIIDWINIRGEFWTIASIIEDIQMPLRKGIVVIVLQKTAGKSLGTGADFGKFFPAVYLTIDPPAFRTPGSTEAKLTVIKVKSSPQGARTPEGKRFAFEVVDRGSKFHNIREVENCLRCKSHGYLFDRKCDKCYGKGYIEIE